MLQAITTAPLNDAELAHLKDIYYTRRNTFSGAFGVLSLMMLVACYRVGVAETGFVLCQVPIALICLRLYRKRILPFKKDIQNGVKEFLPYTIISRKHFPNTGQYFFSFNDPNYMHYEVDEIIYNNYAEGDIIRIPRAPGSKYVFDEKGKFSIL